MARDSFDIKTDAICFIIHEAVDVPPNRICCDCMLTKATESRSPMTLLVRSKREKCSASEECLVCKRKMGTPASEVAAKSIIRIIREIQKIKQK